jgi:heme A synthase
VSDSSRTWEWVNRLAAIAGLLAFAGSVAAIKHKQSMLHLHGADARPVGIGLLAIGVLGMVLGGLWRTNVWNLYRPNRARGGTIVMSIGALASVLAFVLLVS